MVENIYVIRPPLSLYRNCGVPYECKTIDKICVWVSFKIISDINVSHF